MVCKTLNLYEIAWGNNLNLIAKEKAGIIKKGALCISAPQLKVVEKVIINKCNKHEVKLVICDEKSLFSITNYGFKIYGLNKKNYFFIFSHCLWQESQFALARKFKIKHAWQPLCSIKISNWGVS